MNDLQFIIKDEEIAKIDDDKGIITFLKNGTTKLFVNVVGKEVSSSIEINVQEQVKYADLNQKKTIKDDDDNANNPDLQPSNNENGITNEKDPEIASSNEWKFNNYIIEITSNNCNHKLTRATCEELGPGTKFSLCILDGKIYNNYTYEIVTQDGYESAYFTDFTSEILTIFCCARFNFSLIIKSDAHLCASTFTFLVINEK